MDHLHHVLEERVQEVLGIAKRIVICTAAGGRYANKMQRAQDIEAQICIGPSSGEVGDASVDRAPMVDNLLTFDVLDGALE